MRRRRFNLKSGVEGTVIPFYPNHIHGRRPCRQCDVSVKSCFYFILFFGLALFFLPTGRIGFEVHLEQLRHNSPITITPTFHRVSF